MTLSKALFLLLISHLLQLLWTSYCEHCFCYGLYLDFPQRLVCWRVGIQWRNVQRWAFWDVIKSWMSWLQGWIDLLGDSQLNGLLGGSGNCRSWGQLKARPGRIYLVPSPFLALSLLSSGCNVSTFFSATACHQDVSSHHRSRNNGPSWPWTETFEAGSQNKIFLLLVDFPKYFIPATKAS